MAEFQAIREAQDKMYLEGLRAYFLSEFEDDAADGESANGGVTKEHITGATNIHDLVYLIEKYYGAESQEPEIYEAMVRTTLLGPFLPFLDVDDMRPTRERRNEDGEAHRDHG